MHVVRVRKVVERTTEPEKRHERERRQLLGRATSIVAVNQSPIEFLPGATNSVGHIGKAVIDRDLL